MHFTSWLGPKNVQKLLYETVRLEHHWIKPTGFDTGVKVYNCIAKDKVPLIVRNQHLTTWYTCGPTVYDSAHIGHASCYVKLDIIQRVLRNNFSLNLITVMNVTDIDDKIIKRSIELKASIRDLTRRYESEFWEDMQSLNVTKPNVIIRVTDHIPTIEKFVLELLRKGDAYKDGDGSIIFRIQDYGKLQNITSEHIANFTIWKAAKENEPFWNIQCGAGRPGWHTECSALASAFFGSTVDIHAGGVDLRFPHHENEEAQSCAYHSKAQWVNYWLHTGHLLQNSTKMSKSLKNTMSIREMLQICSANVFRMMCLMSHYRKNMEFSNEYVHTAKTHLDTFKNFITNCNLIVNTNYLKPHIDIAVLHECMQVSAVSIHKALSDDFDTASCVKVLNNLVIVVNRMLNNVGAQNDFQGMAELASVSNFVLDMLSLLGIDLSDSNVANERSNETELTNILTEFRCNVRLAGLESKDKSLLQLCDGVRNDLNKIGISVKDHKNISSWTK